MLRNQPLASICGSLVYQGIWVKSIQPMHCLVIPIFLRPTIWSVGGQRLWLIHSQSCLFQMQKNSLVRSILWWNKIWFSPKDLKQWRRGLNYPVFPLMQHQHQSMSIDRPVSKTASRWLLKWSTTKHFDATSNRHFSPNLWMHYHQPSHLIWIQKIKWVAFSSRQKIKSINLSESCG